MKKIIKQRINRVMEEKMIDIIAELDAILQKEVSDEIAMDIEGSDDAVELVMYLRESFARQFSSYIQEGPYQL